MLYKEQDACVVMTGALTGLLSRARPPCEVSCRSGLPSLPHPYDCQTFIT